MDYTMSTVADVIVIFIHVVKRGGWGNISRKFNCSSELQGHYFCFQSSTFKWHGHYEHYAQINMQIINVLMDLLCNP